MHLNVVLFEQLQFPRQIVLGGGGGFSVLPDTERFVRHHDANVEVSHSGGGCGHGQCLWLFRRLHGRGGRSSDAASADADAVASSAGGVLSTTSSNLQE